MTISPRIGVALSSGGGRGVFAHTGFVLALQELGIPISTIAGCSAGAVVGGVAASGSDLLRWSETIAHAQTRDFWNPNPWPYLLWNLVVRKGRGWTGFSDVHNAVELIRSNLAVQTFEECPTPFYSLALNLSRGDKAIFSEGELAPRMMASAAMPLLYRPIEIDGDLYTDGAVIELTPTEAICCTHDLDALIIHHAAILRESSANQQVMNQRWSLLEILYRQLYRQHPWYLSDLPLAFHRCPGGCGAVILVLQPELPELVWPTRKGGEAVQRTAQCQAVSLLRPHLTTLTADPRSLSARARSSRDMDASTKPNSLKHGKELDS